MESKKVDLRFLIAKCCLVNCKFPQRVAAARSTLQLGWLMDGVTWSRTSGFRRGSLRVAMICLRSSTHQDKDCKCHLIKSNTRETIPGALNGADSQLQEAQAWRGRRPTSARATETTAATYSALSVNGQGRAVNGPSRIGAQEKDDIGQSGRFNPPGKVGVWHGSTVLWGVDCARHNAIDVNV
jgi:hypothetical protein